MLVSAAARRLSFSSGHGAPGARVWLLSSWACGRRRLALHNSPPSFPPSPCRRECPAALVASRPFALRLRANEDGCRDVDVSLLGCEPSASAVCTWMARCAIQGACEDGCRDVSLLAPAHALPPQGRGRRARETSPQAEAAPGVSGERAAPKHAYLLLQVICLYIYIHLHIHIYIYT